MNTECDDDGQPLSQDFNWSRRLDRGMDELVGIARGVLADGVLVVEEARFLLDWFRRNEPVRKDFFGRQLFDALTTCLADGRMDAEEEDLLVDLLLRFTGGMPVDRPECSYSTTLPLDRPPPAVQVAGQAFCFTGKFEFGTRQKCEVTVMSAGGAAHKYPTRATQFLVIGELGSRDWIHSNSGRKIERAIEIRTQGHGLHMIAEDHWARCVGPLCPGV